ncbi:Zinc metalloproteinase nas-4 [Pseudolycoriella hygida]|uniref:Metalloendopeptidase n=1 Tax=Pseudolycoriella hygida TaxID=35572 RepID=A0A9Q0RYR9_9DIPT|nr:Zinc metalloproteinase nas-4 [Pseudolycoriella hygida]
MEKLLLATTLLCTLHLLSLVQAHPVDETLLRKLGFIDLTQYGRTIFGEPDNSTGEILAKYNPEVDAGNPEELGSYLEGDILMPLGQARNGLSATSARWAGGVVPYEIRGSFDAFQMNLIEKALNEYHTRTCIRFVPRSNQQDYISIVNGNTGCWSSVGRIGGRQEVNFQTPGCMVKVGTVVHELMHALGFLHEQNRSERDGYVYVNWNNIKAGTENNFEKASSQTTDAFGVGYDYGSVMHYSANAFSKNGQPTLVAKYSGPRMGQRDGFSGGDIAKINQMYSCQRTYNGYTYGGYSAHYPYGRYTYSYGSYPSAYNNIYYGRR